ncbi:MAG: putative rane protein [Gemmatimonadetes bacterium]|nr:putative rane protein [Gemmatimonadota bacterium]
MQTQDFSNHKRHFPLFHFIASPLLAVYVVYSIYALVRAPSLATAMGVVLAAGVTAALFASRLMVLTVQNRVIRLEMTMRLQRVLGAAAAADALAKLSLGRLLALRFASDAELPVLITRVLSQELSTNLQVKQAIREWQPDLLRA